MTEHVIDIDGMSLSVVDVASTESRDDNVSPIKTRKRGTGRGRTAFAEGFCEIHGPAEDGSPCAKFSNLPGDGIGAYRPNFYRRLRSFLVGLIKPVVLVGFVAGALFAGYSFLPNLFSLDNFVPGTPTSGNHKSVTDTNGNRNNDGNRNGNANSNNNRGADTTRRTNGTRPKSNSRVGSSVRSNASPTDFGSSRFTFRL